MPAFLSLAPATTVELVDRLTTRIYLPLEFIVMAHEKGREMYSILRGKVEILPTGDESGRGSVKVFLFLEIWNRSHSDSPFGCRRCSARFTAAACSQSF